MERACVNFFSGSFKSGTVFFFYPGACSCEPILNIRHGSRIFRSELSAVEFVQGKKGCTLHVERWREHVEQQLKKRGARLCCDFREDPVEHVTSSSGVPQVERRTRCKVHVAVD
jgi:hypothetical protein